MIGSGAGAFQFVPHIAGQADSVAVFQRTPPWVLPVENYTDTVPEGKHWLLKHVPYDAKWFRFSVFWRSCEGMLSYTTVDPQWQDERYHSVSAANHEVCELLLENLREQLVQECQRPHNPELALYPAGVLATVARPRGHGL